MNDINKTDQNQMRSAQSQTKPVNPNKKYYIILGVLSFFAIIIGIIDVVICITKVTPNNQPNAPTVNDGTNIVASQNIETLAKQVCAKYNGSFTSEGKQYYMNATNYYTCKTEGNIEFDISTYDKHFTEDTLVNMTYQSMKDGNTDGITTIEATSDNFKGYESYTNGYLFLAAYDNIYIEIHKVKNIEEGNEILEELGYPTEI
jgi:hypothetical protein